jgi:hypothetical protein
MKRAKTPCRKKVSRDKALLRASKIKRKRKRFKDCCERRGEKRFLPLFSG